MKHQQSLTFEKILKSFISGGIAGVFSKTIIAPIQRVKYIYLTRSTKFTYKAAIKDFIYIVKTHGYLNLWRGNMINVFRVFPHAAIDFGVFDLLRKLFYKKEDSFKSRVILFACGSLSGMTAITTTTPLEFLRIRMAMEKDIFSYKDYRSAIIGIYQKQGLRGFYRGYIASIMGITIYHGTGFFIFTKIKQKVKSAIPEHHNKWYVDFIVGSISSFGQFIAYPFDMVKKRMQGQNLLVQRGELKQFSNYRALIKMMYQEGIIKSFYKGITVNFIKAPLAMATAWTVKNQFNRLLDKTYDF